MMHRNDFFEKSISQNGNMSQQPNSVEKYFSKLIAISKNTITFALVMVQHIVHFLDR